MPLPMTQSLQYYNDEGPSYTYFRQPAPSTKHYHVVIPKNIIHLNNNELIELNRAKDKVFYHALVPMTLLDELKRKNKNFILVLTSDITTSELEEESIARVKNITENPIMQIQKAIELLLENRERIALGNLMPITGYTGGL